jgi:hypothetical protein
MAKDQYDPGDLKKRLMDFVMRRKFNLKQDFPKLMRRYKQNWLEKEPVPTVIPFR